MAEETHGQINANAPESAADAFNLGVEAESPAAKPAPSQALEFDTFKQPFFLRHRVASAPGVLVTAAWLSASAWYIHSYIGWAFVLQLLPHVLGGMGAGVLAP